MASQIFLLHSVQVSLDPPSGPNRRPSTSLPVKLLYELSAFEHYITIL